MVYAALTDEIRRVLLQSRTAEARVVSPLHTQLNKMMNQASEGATTADFKFLIMPPSFQPPLHSPCFCLPCLHAPSQRSSTSSRAPLAGANCSSEIAVHKVILAARSDFFARRFASDWSCLTSIPVPGGDVAHTLLRSLVRWAYTDTIAVPRQSLQQLTALASHLQLARLEAALALHATSQAASPAERSEVHSATGVLHVDCEKVLNTRADTSTPVRQMLLDDRQSRRLPSQLPFGSAGSSFKGTSATFAPPRIAQGQRSFSAGSTTAGAPTVPTTACSAWGPSELHAVLPLSWYYAAARAGAQVALGAPSAPALLVHPVVAPSTRHTHTAATRNGGGAAASGNVFRLEEERLSSMPGWLAAKGLLGRPGVSTTSGSADSILQLRTAASVSHSAQRPGGRQDIMQGGAHQEGNALDAARRRTLEHDMLRLLSCVQRGGATFSFAWQHDLVSLAVTPLATDDSHSHCTVHKEMFLARSPYWRAQFAPEFAAMRSGHERVDLTGVSRPVVSAVMRFVYACAGVQAVDRQGVPLHEFSPGHLAADVPPTLLSCDELIECAHLSDLLLLPDLRALCAAAAVKCVSMHTAVPFYAMADAFAMKRLASQCARVMAVHLDSCVLAPEWLQLVQDSASSIQQRQETDSVPLVDDIMGELLFVESAITLGLEQSYQLSCAGSEDSAHTAADSAGEIVKQVRQLPEHILNCDLSDKAWTPRAAAARRRRLVLAVLRLMGISVLMQGG